MSRKYNRKERVIELAGRVVEKTMNDPYFILQNLVNPKPKYLPLFLWKWIIKKVVKFSK